MGSDAKKAYGAIGRDDLLYFDPEEILIVTDKDHALFDERAFKPPSEGLIRSIMKRGIYLPVVIRKNGEDKNGKAVIEVVDGRKRVRAAQIANHRLREAGEELVRVPAVRKRGDDGDLMEAMIITNEHREDDPPLIKARKLQRYLDRGRTLADAEVAFGTTTATLKTYLALLDCHSDVQKALEKGRIGVTHAKMLSAMPQEEQATKLVELLERKPGETTSKASEALSEEKNLTDRIEEALGGRGKIRNRVQRTKKDIKAFKQRLEKSRAADAPLAMAVLDWALGNDAALKKFRGLTACLEAVDAETDD